MVNLLDLPAEIRWKIYQEMDEISRPKKVFMSLSSPETPAILQVNRQLRFEARQVLSSNICWHIFIQSYDDLQAGVYPCVIDALRNMDESGGLWRIQQIRLIYIIRRSPLFSKPPLGFYAKHAGGLPVMELLTRLLAKAGPLRRIEIKWNDHCPEMAWSEKWDTFLVPLAALPTPKAVVEIIPQVAYRDGGGVWTDTEFGRYITDIMGVRPTSDAEDRSNLHGSSFRRI